MRPGRSEPALPDSDVVAAVTDPVLSQDPGQLVTGDPGHAFLAGSEDPGGELRAIPVEDPHHLGFAIGTGHDREYAHLMRHPARDGVQRGTGARHHSIGEQGIEPAVSRRPAPFAAAAPSIERSDRR